MDKLYMITGIVVVWSVIGGLGTILAFEAVRSIWQALRITNHVSPIITARRKAAGEPDVNYWWLLFRSHVRSEFFGSQYTVTRIEGREFYRTPWAEKSYLRKRNEEIQARWDAEDAWARAQE